MAMRALSSTAISGTRTELALRFTLITLIVVAVAGCPSSSRSPSEPAAQPPPQESPPAPSAPVLGYAGPSVVTRIAVGVTENHPAYDAWDGPLVKDLNGTGFEGCDVYRWARLDNSNGYCWANFNQMLAAYPGTDRILFMAGFKPGREVGVAETRQVALELQAACTANRVDGEQCSILISGLPDYIGTCGGMPTNGIPQLTRTVADSLVAGTQNVVRGPDFSPITSEDVSDTCHQDRDKRAEHAAELLSYLGEI